MTRAQNLSIISTCFSPVWACVEVSLFSWHLIYWCENHRAGMAVPVARTITPCDTDNFNVPTVFNNLEFNLLAYKYPSTYPIDTFHQFTFSIASRWRDYLPSSILILLALKTNFLRETFTALIKFNKFIFRNCSLFQRRQYNPICCYCRSLKVQATATKFAKKNK